MNGIAAPWGNLAANEMTPLEWHKRTFPVPLGPCLLSFNTQADALARARALSLCASRVNLRACVAPRQPSPRSTA